MAEKQLHAEALRTSERFTTRIIQWTAIGFGLDHLAVITGRAHTDFDCVTACERKTVRDQVARKDLPAVEATYGRWVTTGDHQLRPSRKSSETLSPALRRLASVGANVRRVRIACPTTLIRPLSVSARSSSTVRACQWLVRE
jgi:hypothetical protein